MDYRHLWTSQKLREKKKKKDTGGGPIKPSSVELERERDGKTRLDIEKDQLFCVTEEDGL